MTLTCRTNMAESAEERRARLKAMRAEAQAAVQQEDDVMEEDQREDRQQSSQDASVSGKEDAEPVLRFRNYLVKDDKSIAHTKVIGRWIMFMTRMTRSWRQG